MTDKKKNILRLLIVSTCAVTIVMALVFFNQTFYTKKEYSLKQAEKVISMISELREGISGSNASIKNGEYNVDFFIDKKYAYENNFPYYDSLAFNIETSNNDNGEYILNLDATLGEDELGKINIFSNQDSYYYYFPSLSDKIIKYDKTESLLGEYDSLFSKMVVYSELSSDETYDLFVSFFLSTIEFLPDICFSADRSAFGKSVVMISAKDDELGDALGKAIEESQSNDNFRRFTESVFSEEDITNLAEGFKQVEASGNNVYSITIESGYSGVVNKISISCVVDEVFHEYSLSLSKNQILLLARDNSNFKNGLKEYTDKTLQINYGKNSDGTYKGLISYEEDLGYISAEFDNFCLKNGQPYGTAAIGMANGNVMCLSLEENHADISINSDEDKILGLDIDYVEKEVTNQIPLESGQITTDYDEYWNEAINSEGHTVLLEKLQAEKLIDWISSWRFEEEE